MAVRRRVGSWGFFWDALQGTASVAVTVLAALFAFLMWKWGPDIKIPLWMILAPLFMFLLVLVALIEALRCATKMISFGSTRIIKVKSHHAPHPDCECICIIETAEPWGLLTAISFQWDDGGYERPLGFGSVIATQDNGAIVVALSQLHEGTEPKDFVKRLLNGEKEAFDQLRVKAVVILPLPHTKAESTRAGIDPASAVPSIPFSPLAKELPQGNPVSSSSSVSTDPQAKGT